ncbi:transcriptional regulator [Vibrio europaeus]|uniref:Transcriptional regulator n=1 Tax=Vibrio europaeus TaxID=300876 RepID=A0A178JG54_9VIBR|nr:transcriptional regulator [Vibrio europaeus]MDC5704596.1 transcriptional regulator [Vibrio europaeus]MDC5712052.1 transcriptional regulator [Vibrio europaeus]MDC5717780.1 transcriptional regulator [Vibrio europaeus]MDC5718133.1 transcriptional regulator [Vibrio europaeus]MDC5727719.1 transcriptional regulator [Vibrio europaeus]
MSNIGTKFNLDNRFTFDPNTNSLVDKENNNELIRLGSNESRILLLLCEKPSEIVSRNDLHDFVWRKQGFEVDDSSLTQAISTLRKLLKDSTKSPMFVKTVPKRGYQLICSVERATTLMSGEPLEEESSEIEAVEVTEQIKVEETVETPVAPKAVSSVNETAETQVPVRKPSSLLSKLLIVVAFLIPLCVILFTNPAESKFRQLGVFDNTVVKAPMNHPDLSKWYPSIEQCVKKYNETHVEALAPVEVIATGGQNNQLILNYIHSLDNSGENITLRIFAEQQDLSKVCQ